MPGCRLAAPTPESLIALSHFESILGFFLVFRFFDILSGYQTKKKKKPKNELKKAQSG